MRSHWMDEHSLLGIAAQAGHSTAFTGIAIVCEAMEHALSIARHNPRLVRSA
jgi:hypothetical protein